jgi:hypothetical protein
MAVSEFIICPEDVAPPPKADEIILDSSSLFIALGRMAEKIPIIFHP